MKKSFLLLTLIVTFLLQSCIGWGTSGGDDIGQFSIYEPVIMQRSNFETTTTLDTNSRPIENTGKIYVKDDYIFINEVNKGFYIINNTNPSNPINVGFINVLGASDLSIKGDVFYVNNATDLLAFTIDQSIGALNITKRLENVFPQIWSPEGEIYYAIEENEIIIDWQLTNNE
ncbi:hypothetical protein [Winogradskyella sp. PE311]|uniref:hypothetical protein n=1 Tax=Winogradskyella sp. PE311 TaxID=3366943 RepID=UPI00397F19BE